ncbi:uncharacterized protein J3D65DRAFT_2912 [Phyllosticta citribraziliensis]|uniref:Uncharacterized protein n=1 Tax=Phyllosticta citribraziliensis TaxID=989973 RepID=A0ABR1M821_9PEZI
MHAFSTHTNTNTSGSGAPPQLVRSTGIARRPRRPAPAPAPAPATPSQPPAGAARRRDYRSEQDLLRGNDDGGASGSTTQKPTRAWRTWPTQPPTLIPAPAPGPAPTPPASLAIGVGVGAVGQQTPQIRHQLQSRRSFAARVEASTGPATAPRADGGRGGGRDLGPDGEDEVALLTGGRIPRSFSTSAQTRVAAVHRRRGVEVSKGAAGRGAMGGLPVIAETTTVAHGASAGRSRAASAAVVAVPATVEGGGGGETPPRLPFLAFSGTGHLPLQDGDAAARAARKNALLAELYALETQSAVAAGGGQETDTDAHGVGTPHERERQIIAELMDLVHEYAVVEENRYLPGEQRHDRERGQGGAVVELPAYDARSYTFPQPAYSRRPVWPGPQTHPQQQPQAPSPELYASEPWAVKPRRPGVPVIGLGNVLHGRRRQDEVYGEEGQSSRSFPANRSEFQVETLFRESMLEARQRQEEEEAMMAEQRVGGLHEAAAGSPSPSPSYPSSTGLSDNTAAAVGSGNAEFAVEQTLPSIYMIRPTGREPPEPTIDPRYNANLDETRLTPPGAPKAKMRRRLAGLRGQGLDDAPEVVTAEMLGVPEIAAAAEQKAEVEGAQCRSLEPGELPLPTMRRQGSGRQVRSFFFFFSLLLLLLVAG